MKVLLDSFYLEGQTLGFYLQSYKLEPFYTIN